MSENGNQLTLPLSWRKPVERVEDEYALEWRKVSGLSVHAERQIFFGRTPSPASETRPEKQIELPIACTCSFRPYPHIITDPIERMRHEWEPMK